MKVKFTNLYKLAPEKTKLINPHYIEYLGIKILKKKFKNQAIFKLNNRYIRRNAYVE